MTRVFDLANHIEQREGRKQPAAFQMSPDMAEAWRYFARAANQNQRGDHDPA